jgi:hypothetical protein
VLRGTVKLERGRTIVLDWEFIRSPSAFGTSRKPKADAPEPLVWTSKFVVWVFAVAVTTAPG